MDQLSGVGTRALSPDLMAPIDRRRDSPIAHLFIYTNRQHPGPGPSIPRLRVPGPFSPECFYSFLHNHAPTGITSPFGIQSIAKVATTSFLCRRIPGTLFRLSIFVGQLDVSEVHKKTRARISSSALHHSRSYLHETSPYQATLH